MDVHNHRESHESPYINEIDLQPPSPDSAQHLDLYSTHDYNNSPYSSHSDLSFTDGQLGLFSDDVYDPSEFDNPNSGQSLLMFDDAAPSDYYSYYRSPSPSGSDNNDDNRSHASSASSHFQSPHMTVAHSFENMTFHSPSWNTEPLPSQHKPPSPPRLLMPEQPPIIVNAPEDGSDLGPRLHIVPATPVSGGGAVANIASSQVGSSSPWLDVVDSHSNISSRSPSPSHSLAATPPAPSRSPSTSPQPAHAPFLFPQQPRSRSKSDTALEPPNWNTVTGGEGFSEQPVYQGGTSHPPTLGNFSFGGSASASSSQQINNGNGYLSPEYSEFELGGGGGGTQLRRSKSDAGGSGGGPRHRLSRSEDIRGAAVYGSGNSDMYLTAGNTQINGQESYLYPPTAHSDFVRSQQQQQQQQQQAQYLSPSMRVPELMQVTPSHSHSQSLSHTSHGHSNSLSGTQNFASNHSRGHYRRPSSGSRSERGTSAGNWDGGLDVNSNRVSPYPSPNASPRGRFVPLSSERADEYDFGGLGVGIGAGLSIDTGGLSLGMPVRGGQAQAITVSKPNVTTGRTANASQRRRKQEATFVCPVQGCGSTFTRSFNLKGHIRSHNEEKPFQCHWPGCGKGFARQHDCKRHEQLHTNYRPFNCEGCGKQFARMDALNRHLRSEGGAECLKLQEANGGLGSTSSAEETPPPPNKSSNASANATSSSSSSSASSPSSAALSVSTAATSVASTSTYTLGHSRNYSQGQQQMGYGGPTKMEENGAWGCGAKRGAVA